MGAIALNSCVDDKESASVTAIRNAKVEQLKAMAEATTLNAQATLALTNAQVAAQQALAAYHQAQAAQLEAQTEKEKELAAVEVQEAQARLQATLASYEKEIAQSKYWQFNYEKQLADLKKDVDAEAARELDELIDKFNTASKNLISAKRTLARDNASLIKLQAGLEDMSTTINKSIQDKEDENAEKKVEIANQQAIIDTYEKYAGTTVSQKDIDAALLKMLELQTAQAKASEEDDAAREAFNEAKVPLNDYLQEVRNWGVYENDENEGNVYEEFYTWLNETTGRWDNYTVNILKVDSWEAEAPAAARGKYCVVVNYKNETFEDDEQPLKDYLPLFEGEPSYIDSTLVYTLSTGEEHYRYQNIKTYYNLIDGGKALETLVSFREKNYAFWNDPENIESVKKQLADDQKAQAAAQTAFDKAVTDYNTAKAAADVADAALENNTDADKYQDLQDKANAAWGKVWAAETTKSNALSTLDSATKNVYNSQKALNSAEFWAEVNAQVVEDFKADVAELIEMASTLDANVKAYNEANDAAAKAWVAYLVANDAANVQSQEYYTLNSAGDGGIVDGNWEAKWKVISAKNEINNLTQQIKDNEDWIETYKQDLADLEAGKNTEAEWKKQEIEDKKAEIEKDTVEVETCQQKYDIAKEALEAAIKSDEPAETPAE